MKDQAGTSVALTIEDKKAETTAGELGFHWSNQDEAEKELKSYVGGSLIRQYMNKRIWKRHQWMFPSRQQPIRIR